MPEDKSPPCESPPLSPELLLHAYIQGAFPMAEPDTGEVHWFSPDPRGVLPLDDFRVRRSLRRVVRSGKFIIRSDKIMFETFDQGTR